MMTLVDDVRVDNNAIFDVTRWSFDRAQRAHAAYVNYS